MTFDRADHAYEHKLIQLLQQSWSRINKTDLDGQLSAPVFALDDATNRLGRWQPATRTIGISIEHLQTAHWLEIELTLRHEMAHQVVSELFGAPHSPPHGELFRRACKMLKIVESPRHQGVIDAKSDRILRRVRKLMALAAATTAHEAQSAMAAASRLLLKHNLEMSEAEHPSPYTYRWIGTPSGRISLERKLISRILQDHFFVQCIWVGTSTPMATKKMRVLEIIGHQHNLDLAEYVHDFLQRTLDMLWDTYKKQTNQGATAVRNEYRVGVVMGFAEYLENQRPAHENEGLIWLGDPALDEFLSDRYPRTTRMSRSAYRIGKTHDAGRRDGRQLRIRPGIRTGNKSRSPKLIN